METERQPFGNLVVLTKKGTDAMAFPLHDNIMIGRAEPTSHIRINVPSVSRRHAEIVVLKQSGSVLLTNLSKSNPALINGQKMTGGSSLSSALPLPSLSCHETVAPIAPAQRLVQAAGEVER